jgi:uncharacterized membrane protein
MTYAWAAVVTLACTLAACDQTVLFGPPTGATCPPSSTLTYDNFGQSFMTSYCTRCHASTLTGSERMGAPLLHDFDTLPGILVFIDHIDETAAAGPDATNTSMPIGDPGPTIDERTLLGEWLACGAP